MLRAVNGIARSFPPIKLEEGSFWGNFGVGSDWEAAPMKAYSKKSRKKTRNPRKRVGRLQMSISRTPSENRQELLPVCSVVSSWSFFINAALFDNVEWARLKLVALGGKGRVPMRLAT